MITATGTRAVIETRGLSKRYRNVSALSDCTITVPEGRISALIGPNGAGKTTLLRLLAGLARPTAGEALVLGTVPRQDPAFLADIGFLAQEIPLYRRMSAADHIGIGAHLNPRWDAASVRQRLDRVAHSARPAGGHAVRGPACPGGAGADPGQAAEAAAARRAGRGARPAGQAELPRHTGRRGGRRAG